MFGSSKNFTHPAPVPNRTNRIVSERSVIGCNQTRSECHVAVSMHAAKDVANMSPGHSQAVLSTVHHLEGEITVQIESGSGAYIWMKESGMTSNL